MEEAVVMVAEVGQACQQEVRLGWRLLCVKEGVVEIPFEVGNLC